MTLSGSVPVIGYIGPKLLSQKLTILFADIANSTWLYQTKGDVVAHRIIAECLEELTLIVSNNQGEVLRTVGDSVLADFAEVDNAFLAAVSMQRSYLKSHLSLRVGFHVGDVIPDRGDVYGNAVNIAARIASFAKPTEIYTSDETVKLLAQEYRSRTGFLDKVEFKGVTQPLAVHRVIWRDSTTEDNTSDTKIVNPKEDTTRYQIDYRLELRVGDEVYCVDPTNPLITIGRADANDIVIDHESTSRHHAVVEFVRGKYQFRDISTNGSYVISANRNAHFLRREPLVIESFGVIGVGWKPQYNDTKRIEFRTVAMGTETQSEQQVN